MFVRVYKLFWQARDLYSATYKTGVLGNGELPVVGSVGDINHSEAAFILRFYIVIYVVNNRAMC